MCRWIAFISEKPVLLEDILINPPHSITKQIDTHYIPDIPRGDDFDERNAPFNLHGFGITWYSNARSQFGHNGNGLRPELYKTTALPTVDPIFNYICSNTASQCILAHIRAATFAPVISVNNHPFVFGRHSFMHNGAIVNFHQIRLEMLSKIDQRYADMIHGNTDSEYLAALYFTHLGDIDSHYTAESMTIALTRAIFDVQEIQARRFAGQAIANSMNICTTDGESLVALRWRNHPIQEPPSLYVSYTPAVSLDRRHEATQKIASNGEELPENEKSASEQQGQEQQNQYGWQVIVASEPATFNQDQWLVLKNGEFIMMDKGDYLLKRNVW